VCFTFVVTFWRYLFSFIHVFRAHLTFRVLGGHSTQSR
jgi:hypothetical protein